MTLCKQVGSGMHADEQNTLDGSDEAVCSGQFIDTLTGRADTPRVNCEG